MIRTRKKFLRTIFESIPDPPANPMTQPAVALIARKPPQPQTNNLIEIMKTLFKSLACTLSLAALSAGSLSGAEKKDIVDTAVAAGAFKTLAAALGAAGLVDTLKGEGPFTVFAPTDEAFAKLPAGTVESLLKPENKAKLKDILTYHVVAGNVASDAAMKLTTATALNKKAIKLEVKDGALYLNASKVTTADVKCSNGVIHIIDTVLLPPDEKK
jgi:uncharacterized surface protein with fasciclin (FAS1) repeats